MKLPCKSVCDAPSYSGSTCQGLMEGLSVMAGGMCFDTSLFDPNTATCNAIAGSLFGPVTVAPHKEAYIGAACVGVVSETYLGDTSKITEIPGLAPLLPPYVQQSLIELTTAPIFASVPRFLYEACSLELRKMFCSLKYMPAQTLTSLNAMFGGPVYMPQFPSQAHCQTYRNRCGPFFILAKSLDMNCAIEVAPGTPLFPVANVVLAVIPDGAGGNIYLQTDVNEPSTAAGYTLATQCPYGFSAGEEEGKRASDYRYMLTLSASVDTPNAISPCKLQCPVLAVDTFDDWKAQQNRQVGCDFVTMFILTVLVVNMFFQEKGKRNDTVYAFVLYLLTNQVLCCASFMCTWFSDEELQRCDGPLTFETGNGAFGALLFIPVALLRSWFVYVVLYVNACVTLEVWLRVFWQIKNIDKLKLGYSITLAIVAFVMWIVPFLYYANEPLTRWASIFYNFPHGYPNNFKAGDAPHVFTNIYVIPLVAYYGFATLVTIHMLYYCVSVSSAALSEIGTEKPLLKLWKTYSALISFNFVFQAYALGILLLCICYEYLDSEYSVSGMSQDISSYFACMIEKFVSLDADPSGGTAGCGLVHPNSRSPFVNTQLFYFLLPCPLALVAKIAYTDDAGKFYWHCTPASVQNLINMYFFAQKVHVIDSTAGRVKQPYTVATKEEANSEEVL